MSKSEDAATCAAGTGLCCSACALIGGAISFLVFGILFLVEDWTEYSSCKGSELGPYVIVALVLTWANGNAAKTKNEDNDICSLILSLMFYFLLNTGLAIWGGIELWVRSCSDLSDTNLWKFSLAVFILQVVSASISLLIPCVVFVAALKDKNSVDTDKSMFNADNISALGSAVSTHDDTRGDNEV